MSKIKRDIQSFVVPYGYIYEHKNQINGKRYIGQTTNEKGYRDLIHGYINNSYLFSSIKKYGLENFETKILDSANNKKDLDEKEEYYIQKYNTMDKNKGYNLKHGGANGKLSEETKRKMSECQKGIKNSMYGCKGENHPMYNKKHTKESKKKMSIAHKGQNIGKNHHLYGKHLSEEVKKKLSEAHKGQIPWHKGKKGVYSKETLKKMSIIKKGKIPWNKGKKLSEEHKKKLSESHKGMLGKFHTEETKRKIGRKHKGKQYSEESRKKMSESHKGKKQSNETKRKISESLKKTIRLGAYDLPFRRY